MSKFIILAFFAYFFCFSSSVFALTRLLANGEPLDEILPTALKVQKRHYIRGPDGAFWTEDRKRYFQIIKCDRHNVVILYRKKEHSTIFQVFFSEDYKKFQYRVFRDCDDNEEPSFEGRGHVEDEGDREFLIIPTFLILKKEVVFVYNENRLLAVNF